jgi:N-acetyl sugar amidotransferase
MSTVKTCSRCILDDTVSDIWYDTNGQCKYCKIHDEMEERHPLNPSSKHGLNGIIYEIKKKGKRRTYDCIVGVSGGRDSTYTLYKAVEYGLRPLAVHFDNGWNTEISVSNIKKACEKLKVDLYTIVADWEEFKDLQISFLKASVPDADIPSDYAIYSVLYQVAYMEGIKYILNGHSFRTEGTSPISWTYMDGKYVKSVHKKFGSIKKIKSFPIMNLSRLLFYVFLKRIKEVRLMEYIDYRKDNVDEELKRELNWQYYGGHHHENSYTEFFQSYFLPKKFNIDKRKIELSALIRTGQISREHALILINENQYEYKKVVIDYALSKLGISNVEFEEILKTQVRSHNDYPTYLPVIRFLRFAINIAAKLKIVPHILYLKYAS